MRQGQRGVSMLEVMVASAILGVAGVAIILALTTGLRAQDITKRDVIAENLVRNALEEIRSSDPQYQGDYNVYIVTKWAEINPTTNKPFHTIPQGYKLKIKTDPVCPACLMSDGDVLDVLLNPGCEGDKVEPVIYVRTIFPSCPLSDIQLNTVTVLRDGRPLITLEDLKTRR